MEQKPKKETWNIYVELQQLLREVYRALFGMPKKDRVVLGDRIMSAATDALTFYNLAYKFNCFNLKKGRKTWSNSP